MDIEMAVNPLYCLLSHNKMTDELKKLDKFELNMLLNLVEHELMEREL